MKQIKLKAFKLAAMVLFAGTWMSCSDDKVEEQVPQGDYEFGYFVTNEGPFQNGSGTVTFIGDDGTVSQNIYKAVNQEDLGNIVNSMYVEGDKAYIVVNNSQRVVVVNRFTFEREAVISGNDVVSPRHFTVVDGTGYISDWGDPFDTSDDFVAVVDLSTNQVLKRIGVGEGPERMVSSGGTLFVALQGGYGQNNRVTVINTATGEATGDLFVGDVPNSLGLDASGNLWVLCGGISWPANLETDGSLYKIDPVNLTSTAFKFGSQQHPGLLNVDGSNLYYTLNGQIYQMSASASSLPTESVIDPGSTLYGMHVENGVLFGTDAKDYASEGEVRVYSLSSGDLMETIPAGIIPGSVVIPN